MFDIPGDIKDCSIISYHIGWIHHLSLIQTSTDPIANFIYQYLVILDNFFYLMDSNQNLITDVRDMQP